MNRFSLGSTTRSKFAFGLIAATVSLFAMEMTLRVVVPRPGYTTRGPDDLQGMRIPHTQREFAYAPDFRGEYNRNGLDELLRENDIPLWVMLLATQNREGNFPREQRAGVKSLGEVLASEGIPTFDVLAALERDTERAVSGGFGFEQDGHWNAAAHERVAEGLADFIAANLLSASRGPL